MSRHIQNTTKSERNTPILKRRYIFKCQKCKEKRSVDYKTNWSIKKRNQTLCFKCSRMERGQLNSGSFKKGIRISPETEFKEKKEIGYWGVHAWIARKKGRPRMCEHCGDPNKKRYDWANVSRTYKREFTDWIRLCSKCHGEFDRGHHTKGGFKKLNLRIKKTI